jgi:hypothetical protein
MNRLDIFVVYNTNMAEHQTTSALIIQKWYRERTKKKTIQCSVVTGMLNELAISLKELKNNEYKKYNVKQTGDVEIDEFNLLEAKYAGLSWGYGGRCT